MDEEEDEEVDEEVDEEMEEAKGLPVRSRLPLSLVELCIIQFCHLAQEFCSVHWVWKRNVLGQQNESSQKYFTHSSHSLLDRYFFYYTPS